MRVTITLPVQVTLTLSPRLAPVDEQVEAFIEEIPDTLTVAIEQLAGFFVDKVEIGKIEWTTT